MGIHSSKGSIFTKMISFFVAVTFILGSAPVNLYADILVSHSLRAGATSGTLVQKELQGDLRNSSTKKDLSERIIVNFSEVGKDDVAIVGGKCANLGELMHIPGINVPDGIALTTKAYQIHIDKGIVSIDGKDMTLREYITKRLEGLDINDTVELGKASKDIRSAMEKAKMPDDVEKAIIEWYHKLGDNVFVAIRSSATAEDLPDASFAGQQETYLFKRGDKEVLDAVKYCWSSLFTPRAIFYRQENKIDHNVAYLSVAIQMMIDSATSGVGFGVDVNYGMPRITVNGAYKLGEGVVSGTVTPDVHDYVYDVFTGEPKFFKKSMGSKKLKSVYKEKRLPTDREATEYVPTTEEERSRYANTNEQAFMVAKAVKAINEYYGKYMDVEWCFDANGKLWVVQARSETIWNKQEKDYPNMVVNAVSEVKEALLKIARVLVKGRTGAPRAATGKVIIINELETGTAEEKATALAEALSHVEKGDIIVTKMTTPDMVPAMKRAAAVITDEGGPNCHAAIVARELRIPCVVGTGNATQVLKNGQIVTVDARRAAVYDGTLEIIKSIKTVDISKLPVIRTLIGIVNSAPDLAMEIWQFSKYVSYYGYGLFRKEFVDTTEILVHPLAGLAYDKYMDPNFKDEAQRKWIKENIIDKYGARIEKITEGYPSFAEFYKDKLATALVKIASAQTKGQRVKYRTTDFKTNEYSGQVGAFPFEPQEKNPMMGYRGIYRMLSASYKDAFELEIEAVKQARKVQTNIDVMFPVVRTPEEAKQAVDYLAKRGLVRGKDFKVFMMAEVPANIFQSEEFYKYVDGVSIGSNDLTQFTLAIGRDNNRMAAFADETNPAVEKGVEVIIKNAKKMGVSSGICGNGPSNNPAFAAFLVRAGIDCISVVPDVFEQVVNVIAQQEKELAGVPYDPNISGYTVPEKIGNPDHINAGEVKASEAIAQRIGIHPLKLLQYYRGGLQSSPDMADLHIAGRIEEELDGMNAKDYVINAVMNVLETEAKNVAPGTLIIYSTDDLDKVAYEQLIGGEKVEGFDENPQLGFCGLARVIDPEYKEFFKWQLIAIKKAREAGINVGIKLSLVRTLTEVNTALAMMKEVGLVPGQFGFMAGMEMATPASVLLADYFINTGINFISENNERFLYYDLALDPQSKDVQYSDEAKQKALDIPRRIWTTAAEKHGIPIVQFEDLSGITPKPTVYPTQPAQLKFSDPAQLPLKFGEANGRGNVEPLQPAVTGTPAVLPSDKVLPIDSLYNAFPNKLRAPENMAFRGTSAGFSNFAGAVNKSGAVKKGGVIVVSANVILENAGAMTALWNFKETKKVVVYANSEAELARLKAMGIEEVTNRLYIRTVNADLLGLAMSYIKGEETALIASESDLKDINNSDIIDATKAGVQMVWLKVPKAHEGKINSMPLIIARAFTSILKADESITTQFKLLSQGYSDKGQISKENIGKLNEFTSQICNVPLVQLNLADQKDKAVLDAQSAYAATVSQI
ncbi:MAG: phosphoenolpyruvate synthase [Candidatus Omnitrophica bacterium]|nr:phosphoenolpyruvate synthase [Candidatus Omnitrophota bacterium]